MRVAAAAATLMLVAGCAGGAEPSTSTDTAPVEPTNQDQATNPASSGEAAATVPPPTVGDSGARPSETAVPGAPVGFATTTAIVTTPDGRVCELCLWLADDPEERARGLMSVTDLGGPAGMAFRYPRPHTGTFWMKDTVLPLSIVFYAPDGTYLDAFDMEPCIQTPCPNYRTATDFLVAVEVPQGELADHGFVPGSTLELLDLPCG